MHDFEKKLTLLGRCNQYHFDRLGFDFCSTGYAILSLTLHCHVGVDSLKLENTFPFHWWDVHTCDGQSIGL